MGEKTLAPTPGILLLWTRTAAVKDKGEGGVKWREKRSQAGLDHYALWVIDPPRNTSRKVMLITIVSSGTRNSQGTPGWQVPLSILTWQLGRRLKELFKGTSCTNFRFQMAKWASWWGRVETPLEPGSSELHSSVWITSQRKYFLLLFLWELG